MLHVYVKILLYVPKCKKNLEKQAPQHLDHLAVIPTIGQLNPVFCCNYYKSFVNFLEFLSKQFLAINVRGLLCDL